MLVLTGLPPLLPSSPLPGLGVVLPLEPPYTTVKMLAAGGVSKDKAKPSTPASDKAEIIDVRFCRLLGLF